MNNHYNGCYMIVKVKKDKTHYNTKLYLMIDK